MYKNTKEAYTPQYETVNSADRIYSLLLPLVGAETAIKFVLPNDNHVIETTLHSINRQNSVFLLTLNRSIQLKPPSKVNIHTHLNGAELSFTTTLLKLRNEQTHQCEIALPTSVKYCQRRMAHRVHVSYAMDVTASFVNEQGDMVEGQLRDLSADGMRVQLSKINPSEITEHKIIPNCVITLPDKSDIHCTFEVRHKHNHKRNKGCTIGGMFNNLETIQKRAIEKFIASLERKSIRTLRA